MEEAVPMEVEELTTPLEVNTQIETGAAETEVKVQMNAGGDVCTFPLPNSWYEPHLVAGRDDMWGYIALNTVVVIKSETGKKWPRFTLLGGLNKNSAKDKYTAISFSQESILPSLPVVTSSELGTVKLWSLQTSEVSKFHDGHRGAHTVVQWSPYVEQLHLIYGMDVQGKLSVWDVKTNSVRMMDIGKFHTMCIAVASHRQDFLAAGAKLGQIYTIESRGRGQIMHKMRHEEEIFSLSWQVNGVWEACEGSKGVHQPFLLSSIASSKQPSIRVWDSTGRDVKLIRPWTKDLRSGKLTKSFVPCHMGKDPKTGMPVLFTCGKDGEILSYADTIPNEVHSIHTNYTIFGLFQCGDILWSLSFEPFIVGWNLRTEEPEMLIPTFRGICAMQASTLEGSRLALGGGDGMIRVLKMNMPEYPELKPVEIDAPLVSSRVTGRVTAIAWNPRRDTQLAFGTDEGVLGIFDFKTSNKYTSMFDRRVKGTVYTVDWGIKISSVNSEISDDQDLEEIDESKDNRSALYIYACGGNNVYMIDPRGRSSNLINIGKIISQVNGPSKLGSTNPTEIKWTPDFAYFAVGYNDGRVELYSAPNLKLRCWFKCHGRSIQAIAWRPHDFLPAAKSTQKWFASAANDGSTRIFNLAELYTQEFKENVDEVVQIMSSAATFNGHGGLRVISLAWSPHDVNLLVTVGYDKTAVVWDIKDGSQVARYSGHESRLVSCIFHPSHPSKVISCSDELITDPCIHIWDFKCHSPNDDHHKSKVLAELRSSADSLAPQKATISLKYDSGGVGAGDFFDPDSDVKSQGGNSSQVYKSTKKAKLTSIMPMTSNRLINAKLDLLDDLKFLIDKVPLPSDSNETGNTTNGAGSLNGKAEGDAKPSTSAQSTLHLSILGSMDDAKKLVDYEFEEHRKRGGWENMSYLSCWTHTFDYIDAAIKDGHVTEHMLLVAAKYSKDLYSRASCAYARQLVEKDEIHRAVNVYLLHGKVEEAVDILLKRKLFREAVVLAKIHLGLDDPITIDVQEKWISFLRAAGNYELAAKIYCSLGRFTEALAMIEQRNHPYAWIAGVYVAVKADNIPKAEALGFKYVEHALSKGNYKECIEIVTENDFLKWLLPIALVHQKLSILKMKSKEGSQEDLQLLGKGFQAEVLEIWQLSEVDDGDHYYSSKIKANMLAVFPQNTGDVELLLTKNLTLLIMEETTDGSKVAQESLKSAKTWFQAEAPKYFETIEAIFRELCKSEVI